MVTKDRRLDHRQDRPVLRSLSDTQSLQDPRVSTINILKNEKEINQHAYRTVTVTDRDEYAVRTINFRPL